MKTRNNLLILILTLSAFAFIAGKQQTDSPPIKSKNTIVLVKYKAQKSKEAEALAALTALIEEVRKEPHFVRITLLTDPKDKTAILLHEEWSSGQYFNSGHMQTPHLKKFMDQSRTFLAGPPQITFWQLETEFRP